MLKIIPRNRKEEKVGMQFLILLFVATISFLFAFISPAVYLYYKFDASKKDGGSSEERSDMVEEFVTFLQEHPTEFYMGCIIITFISVLCFLLGKRKRQTIRELAFDDDQQVISIIHSKFMNKKEFRAKVPYQALQYEETIVTKHKKKIDRIIISFLNKKKRVGIIDTYNILWEKESILIRTLTNKLHSIKKPLKTNNRQNINHQIGSGIFESKKSL